MRIRDENFSESAQEVSRSACRIAVRYGQSLIDIEHILLAILESESEAVYEILRKLNCDISKIRKDAQKVVQGHPKTSNETDIQITSRVAEAIKDAKLESRRLSRSCIEIEHLFLGVLSIYEGTDAERQTYIAKSLANEGVSINSVKFKLRDFRKSEA
jgi:ATP-dependent Clp protease ATP-binding subunit ClpB